MIWVDAKSVICQAASGPSRVFHSNYHLVWFIKSRDHSTIGKRHVYNFEEVSMYQEHTNSLGEHLLEGTKLETVQADRIVGFLVGLLLTFVRYLLHGLCWIIDVFHLETTSKSVRRKWRATSPDWIGLMYCSRPKLSEKFSSLSIHEFT